MSSTYVDTLTWHDDLKLTWNDFKGKKEKQTDAVAVTASGITFSYSVSKVDSRIVDFTSQIEAHFYPDKSWVIKDKADDYILAHEQLHFDITELHVRKFRKQVGEVTITKNLNAVLNKLHQDIIKELAVMQNTYDAESNNSINKAAQAKWMTYVASEMQTYKAFKSKK
jgi:hypothetical protein